MRGVVSASRQVGMAPILSCKCTGNITPGLVAWADHPILTTLGLSSSWTWISSPLLQGYIRMG